MENNKVENIDYSKISDIRFAGLDMDDYPKFCDAYIDHALYDGMPISDELLEVINNNYDWLYDQLYSKLEGGLLF